MAKRTWRSNNWASTLCRQRALTTLSRVIRRPYLNAQCVGNNSTTKLHSYNMLVNTGKRRNAPVWWTLTNRTNVTSAGRHSVVRSASPDTCCVTGRKTPSRCSVTFVWKGSWTTRPWRVTWRRTRTRNIMNVPSARRVSTRWRLWRTMCFLMLSTGSSHAPSVTRLSLSTTLLENTWGRSILTASIPAASVTRWVCGSLRDVKLASDWLVEVSK